MMLAFRMCVVVALKKLLGAKRLSTRLAHKGALAVMHSRYVHTECRRALKCLVTAIPWAKKRLTQCVRVLMATHLFTIGKRTATDRACGPVY